MNHGNTVLPVENEWTIFLMCGGKMTGITQNGQKRFIFIVVSKQRK